MTVKPTIPVEMDYLDPINALNMPETADMTFALEFLLRVKQGVQSTASALTETASPDVRALLRKQLRQSIALHQEITELMIRKKWFHPYELSEQYQLDQQAASKTMEIAQMKLYAEDTRRKGMFDRTPDEHNGGHEA